MMFRPLPLSLLLFTLAACGRTAPDDAAKRLPASHTVEHVTGILGSSAVPYAVFGGPGENVSATVDGVEVEVAALLIAGVYREQLRAVASAQGWRVEEGVGVDVIRLSGAEWVPVYIQFAPRAHP